MDKHESRWGFHPCSYEVYEMLKKLNEGWQWYAAMAATQRRFDAKTKYKGRIWKEPGQPIDHCCEEVFSHKRADEILPDYQNARHPVPDGEVKPLRLPIHLIKEFYDGYRAWMDELMRKHREMMEQMEEGRKQQVDVNEKWMKRIVEKYGNKA